MNVSGKLNTSIRPHYLKEGDHIALVAPGYKILPEVVERASNIFTSWGLKPIVGKNILDNVGEYSASDEKRANDIIDAINDPRIKAIICLRGGYGSIKTIEFIDFSVLYQNPKWFVGFSDITVFHSILNCKLNMETIHGQMPINFDEYSDISINSLKDCLFGKTLTYKIYNHKYNIFGKAKGKLLGGNLSIIQSLAGTIYDIELESSILFIEDIGEAPYKIDRMLMNMLLSGKLEQIEGVLLGAFTGSDQEETYKIIHEFLKNFNIPVGFGFNAGHTKPNLSLYLNRHIELNIDDNDSYVNFI